MNPADAGHAALIAGAGPVLTFGAFAIAVVAAFTVLGLRNHSHSIVMQRHMTLFLRGFRSGISETTDIFSVALFRLPANARG